MQTAQFVLPAGKKMAYVSCVHGGADKQASRCMVEIIGLVTACPVIPTQSRFIYETNPKRLPEVATARSGNLQSHRCNQVVLDAFLAALSAVLLNSVACRR